MARVRHLEQKVAVVGKENQAFAVGVEPSDGAQHRFALQVYQLRDEPSRMNVFARADDAARLVQGDVVAALGRAHRAIVERDFLRFFVHLRSQFRHHLPVHAHAARFNPLFARPPRPDSGPGEHFLQSFLHTLSTCPRPSPAASARPAR